ncbi:MAG: DUF1592 domain-containing protein [Myxococcales bacterium]|nr:DUF1592 domain-containing protein [Myxococcales bacterium]
MNRLLPLLLVASSCTGTVSEPIGSLGAGGGEPIVTGGGTGGGVAEPARTCRPIAAPMRALTARQFDSVVEDLLQDTSRPATVLSRPHSESRFDNHFEWIATDEVLLRFYVSTADALATRALTRQAAVFPCANPTTPAAETQCLDQVLDTFARRAWRHRLSDDEKTSLRTVFTTVRALTGATWNDGLSAVVQVLLQSPQFLYITEVGSPIADAMRPTSQLTPLEIATRLSFLLWGSIPDDALLDAAEQGRLVTKEDVTTQARRLMADPRSRRGYLDFARQWLEVESLATTNKDSTRFPNWNATLAAAAGTELDTLAADTFTSGGTLKDLFEGRSATLTPALGNAYGLTNATGRVDLPTSRAGVLTRVGWLATHAHPIDTSPTLRGKAVRTRFLCEDIPAPPPGVNVMLPNVVGPSTLRQRLAVHLNASQGCAACHLLMDPIGFGLEEYDAAGGSRTTETNGLAIDSSGSLEAGGQSIAFQGGVGLSQTLAGSAQAKRCYLTQTWRYAHGRSETSKDRCHLDAAMRTLGPDATLQDMVLAVVTSDAFLTREPLP